MAGAADVAVGPVTAPEPPPILVIGTTHDPSDPVRRAVT